MKIILQNRFNECGICCANMLINHYYKNDYNLKNELLEQSHLSKNGLSILELENLCKKYKIELTSYKCTKNELFENHNSKPFILIIEHKEQYHYVVGKIVKTKLYIYDPLGTTKIIKINQTIDNWTGYVCFSEFKKTKFIDYKINVNLFKNINWYINIILLAINLCQFITTTILSYFMSKIIALDPASTLVINLLKISVIFLLIIFINFGFGYSTNIFKNILAQKYDIQITSDFFQNLEYKKFDFYQCYSKNHIIQFWTLLKQIVEYYIFYWSDLITKIIMCIISTIILSLIIKQIWTIVLIYNSLSIIVFLYKYYIDNKQQNYLLKNNLIIHDKFLNLLTQKNNNHDYDIDKKSINEIKKIYISNSNLQHNIMNKHHLVDLIWNCVDYLFQFVLLIYFWKTNNFQIALLFFCLNIFNVFKNSLNNIIVAVKTFFHIKPIYKDILNLISTNNTLNSSNKIELKKVNIIEFNKNKFVNNLLINSDNLENHYLIKSMLNINDPLNHIKINEIKFDQFNELDIKKNFVLINNNYSLDSESIIGILERMQDYQFLKEGAFLDLDLHNLNFENLNYNLRFILILIHLLNYQNKIICFNNWDSDFSKNEKQIIKFLFTKINKNNFIISNSTKLMELYDYQI